MKYLYIHKILWFILVLVYTMIECIMVFIASIIYLLWNFKPLYNAWSKFHFAKYDWENSWTGVAYKDKTVWQTIKRRYESF